VARRAQAVINTSPLKEMTLSNQAGRGGEGGSTENGRYTHLIGKVDPGTVKALLGLLSNSTTTVTG
jgi:hypothetical protein